MPAWLAVATAVGWLLAMTFVLALLKCAARADEAIERAREESQPTPASTGWLPPSARASVGALPPGATI